MGRVLVAAELLAVLWVAAMSSDGVPAEEATWHTSKCHSERHRPVPEASGRTCRQLHKGEGLWAGVAKVPLGPGAVQDCMTRLPH